ncbi:hypothetical protein [Buchananella hordeovulneris]|uniref:hypothetical protein n=1 Tax=Buchananella hordeovulneris TaxID=52770 RepID=UPI00116103D6|nr:hypothetical protein [Buchananella hordeovulneris]
MEILMASGKLVYILAIGLCLSMTGCSLEPLDMLTTPLPTHYLRRGDMVTRDEIRLAAPPDWHLTYWNDPESNSVAEIRMPGKNSRDGGLLLAEFLSQYGIFRILDKGNPQETLERAAQLSAPPDTPTKILDTKFLNGHPALAYTYSLTVGDMTQTCEEYLVYRNDGIWKLTLCSPRNSPIPSELRQAMVNVTWTKVTEPNVKFLGSDGAFFS